MFSYRKVRDIMQKNVVSVKFSTPVAGVVQLLQEKNISGVVVVDMVGEFVGIISALDVFKILKEENPDSLIAEDIMTPFTIAVSPEDTLRDAALKMLDNGIHRLVVIASPSKRKPIGIITATDLINNLQV